MTRVLVTGAAGFLGGHLVRACRDADLDVVGLVRATRPALSPVPGRLDYMTTPRATCEELARVLDGIEIVFHLAAQRATADPDSMRACLETNVVFTGALLEACVMAGVRRVLYFSAGNAYAAGSPNPASEDDPLYPVETAPVYLGSKVVAETLVEHYRRTRGLDAVSLRISAPYGSGMPAGAVVPMFIRRAEGGEPLRVLDGGRFRSDFVFVDDVIDLAMAAARDGAPGIYNAGSGVATSIAELAQAVADVFNPSAMVEVVPAEADSYRGFRPLDIARARRTWNWNPRPLRAGLELMRSRMREGQP